MGKKKIIGNCAVDGCQRILDSRGWCTLHYHRFLKNGTTDKINRLGKSTHPNNQAWWDRKDQKDFSSEWQNFWKFVEDVGIRPSKNHYLVKIDRSLPYSKENFKWIEHIKRQKDESEKDWCARKWKQRIRLNPALKEYGKVFRDLLKDTGISLIEYSKIYLQKLEAQNSLCAICLQPETIEITQNRKRKKVRLALDHCHKTMKIRDLLCHRCNHAIGCVKESIPIINSMINYLDHNLKFPSGKNYNNRGELKEAIRKMGVEGLLCEICRHPETRKHPTGKTQLLSIDHCHTTMMIRGTICASCNTALGKVRDSVSILQSMILYLKKHS